MKVGDFGHEVRSFTPKPVQCHNGSRGGLPRMCGAPLCKILQSNYPEMSQLPRIAGSFISRPAGSEDLSGTDEGLGTLLPNLDDDMMQRTT